jgi:membrane dipeptidase
MIDDSPSRRTILAMAGGAILAALGARSAFADAASEALGLKLTEDQIAAGTQILLKHPSVDIHCHPGRFFVRNFGEPTRLMKALGAPTDDEVIKHLPIGHLSGALFCGVADMALLDASPQGGLFAGRDWAAGEAWREYERQINVLKGLSKRHTLYRGRTTRDVLRAQKLGRTANIFAVEGGDFFEDKLDRVHIAYRDGVRAVTIVHYHVNMLGDIQTAAAVHGGLTPTGKAVVQEMNKAGIVIDVAHATYNTTRGVIDASTRPVMLSHSNLLAPGLDNPRLVSAEHANMVAKAGGIIGSVPWGIGQTNVSDWIDSIFRLIDAVGADHVAIGTDMDANFRPVFTDYRQWPLIPAALLARGLHEPEVAAIIGGNFMRVFKANGG